MQKKYSKKLLSCILCMTLMVAMAFSTTGCSDNAEKEALSATEKGAISAPETTGDKASNEQEADNSAQTSDNGESGAEQLGEGETSFLFTVVDKEGSETKFEIHTDKETVGEALVELGLIAGDESEYGLYVKTVNGITVDYDMDGVYWAFYVNDEYAQTGVDSTAITDGDVYAFKVE